jgi:hypothetical protein
MNPRDLENRFLAELENQGYISQKALFSIKHLPSGKIISNRSDFFGVWDIIAIRNNHTFLFQVCSGTTYLRHRKKIEEGFPSTSEPVQCLVFYYKEKGRWKYTVHQRTEAGWVANPSVLIV